MADGRWWWWWRSRRRSAGASAPDASGGGQDPGGGARRRAHLDGSRAAHRHQLDAGALERVRHARALQGGLLHPGAGSGHRPGRCRPTASPTPSRCARASSSTTAPPFDADAVKFTYDRLLDPKHPYAETGPFPFASFYYGAIKEVTVVDPATVRFTLKQPFSPLLNNLTLNTGRIVSPAAVKKYGKEFAEPPGRHRTVQVRVVGQERAIVLEANAGYWAGRAQARAASCSGRWWRSRPASPSCSRAASTSSSTCRPTTSRRSRRTPSWPTTSSPARTSGGSRSTREKKPFNDVRVRRAVNYAVNRDAIADDLLKKHRHRRHRTDPAVDHVGRSPTR